jgi:hypothetical protein
MKLTRTQGDLQVFQSASGLALACVVGLVPGEVWGAERPSPGQSQSPLKVQSARASSALDNFAAPTLPDGTRFEVRPAGGGPAIFSGALQKFGRVQGAIQVRSSPQSSSMRC